jgi:nitrate reductase gamma subunit
LQFNLLLLLAGHLAGLLLPQRILLWNSVPYRLYLLEAFGFAIGLLALGAWSLLMWRHLGTADGSFGLQVVDMVFLSVLFVALLSGSLIAAVYRWASSWSVLTVTPYGMSLLSGRPAIALATDMPLLVRLHVFSSLAALALFPFSRLAVVLTLALRCGSRFILTAVSGLVDPVRSLVNVAAHRLNPTAWIWPEED